MKSSTDDVDVPAWVDTLAHQLKRRAASAARYTMPYGVSTPRPPARMARGSMAAFPHEPNDHEPARAAPAQMPAHAMHAQAPMNVPAPAQAMAMHAPAMAMRTQAPMMMPAHATHAPAMHAPKRFPQIPAPELLDMPLRRGHAGRLLVLASICLLAGATTYVGVRMWRDARRPAAAPAAAEQVMLDDGGRLELAPDRRAVRRTGAITWSAIAPAAVDTLELTGPFALARTTTSLLAIELERGTARFAWQLPTQERWSTARPAVVGACFTILTTRGSDGVLHCVDPETGTPRWSATIAGGAACEGQPAAIADAYVQQCHGWTSVIDAKTGAVTTDAGGLALLAREPPFLAREQGGRLSLVGYQKAQRRFAASGTTLKGTVEAPISMIARGQRVIVRSSASSSTIATIMTKTAAPIVVTVPELAPADETPLVADCDLGGAPRYQLDELSPRVGNTFDPEAAQQRVLAIVDVDLGKVTWTSRRVVLPRRLDGGGTICRHGHYFVPVASGLWVLDATTGQTRSVLGASAGFADLVPTRIGADAVATRTSEGWVDVGWRVRAGGPETDEVERELGRLP